MISTNREFSKKEFNWILQLQRKQKDLLKDKDSELKELFNICDTDSQRELLYDLIIRFNCFDEILYNWALLDLTRHIRDFKYDKDKIALLALCHNSEADSSQTVLNDIKYFISLEIDAEITFRNRFDWFQRYYKEGKRHFIVVDEFIGSGQTVTNAYNDFIRTDLAEATLDFCLVAGMNAAIEDCKNKGIHLYVAYNMGKGISDYYSGDELIQYKDDMVHLEEKLAKKVNETELKDYNFGYKESEALYTKLNRNVPNNVFPIFWWKSFFDNSRRKTILNRVQNGY